ncbi:protein serine/threonine phosphatase 2C [Atractiella rhizophila]|nr:protein serine/threonine phosphatase 2C [Atractiella rhizophila]
MTSTISAQLTLSSLQSPKSTIKASEINEWLDDQEETFNYHKLPASLIKQIFESAGSSKKGTINGVSISAKSFQPKDGSPKCENEDRFNFQKVDFGQGEWVAGFVFDGHFGPLVSNDAVQRIPLLLTTALTVLFQAKTSPTEEDISNVLSSTIEAYDKSLAQEFLETFPQERMEDGSMTEQELDWRFADERNQQLAELVVNGSTVVVALLDAKKENLWIANVGDAEAILGVKIDNEWSVESLAKQHNGFQKEAADELRELHPGESEVVLNGRVLGLIMVTKALGDFHFKLPKVYADRIFFHERSRIGFPPRYPDSFHRCLTPPYLTAKPHVMHKKFDPTKDGEERILVLATDGLRERLDELIKIKKKKAPEPAEELKEGVGKTEAPSMPTDLQPDREIDRLAIHLLAYQSFPSNTKAFSMSNPAEDERLSEANTWMQNMLFADHQDNLATSLIRNACGGKNDDQCSWRLTLEAPYKMQDDVTVVVFKF